MHHVYFCPHPPGWKSLIKKNKFIYFNWKLIALQYCIGFAIHQRESTMGVHVFLILNTHIPPYTISLGHHSAPAPSILYHAPNLDWRFVSHMIIYMFHCHSPKSSHPLRVQKSTIHICVFFPVLHTGSSFCISVF